ncbi:MAG: 3,4-dihydroxy-2-butanone-4-phosphate synthase [Gammaproteobacteria bacterium RIFCSPLOWO2_02_FULL_56_15]|nr:MAG: 3,4-dihydroxy-2-butanone-4-phosphate synthase [Gammaproteobacteria bacterium RIFCSPLOWO2_02_FULL_56_15]
MALHSTEELIEEIRSGRMVILMDDEDRENEGDFVIAAECVRPEDINFMARYGRGLICLTLTRDHCRKLNLPLMARNFYSSDSTNFTVSIEATEGVTTGISAADRAVTIRTAVARDAEPADLIQPGHIFPLMAHPGGVLSRAGHTEAGCDLARLAGFQPASAIVEILNDDGSMARRPDLERLAGVHDLRIGTIADLIRYRTQNERTVERMAENDITTEFGSFRLVAYRDSIDDNIHLAMIKGVIDPEIPIMVRVHLEHMLFDLTGTHSEHNHWPLREVLGRIGREDNGVVVILSHQIESDALINEVISLNDNQRERVSRPVDSSKDLRNIGLGSQILSDLGVRKMRVMGTPKRLHALSGFDLEVVEYLRA